VPARDAMVILGHSRISVTLEIYSHVDEESRRDAVGRLDQIAVSAGQSVGWVLDASAPGPLLLSPLLSLPTKPR
jgi:hypothetical protein